MPCRYWEVLQKSKAVLHAGLARVRGNFLQGVLKTRDIEAVHSYFDTNRASADPAVPAGLQHRGRCYVCRQESVFAIQQDGNSVNWRETLRCETCGLINRWRSGFHLFEQLCRPSAHSRVYITEAITPLHDLILQRYPQTTGSEYSAQAAPGEQIILGERQVLIQDVTRLSFPDQQFDCVLSFDVLEHVADYQQALREFARVLVSGGQLLLSAPFSFAAETQIRATVDANGEIVHLLPPDYHGDPLSDSGVLCFQSFGMDLLDELQQAGFEQCSVCCYTSTPWAYMGKHILYVARKA